MKEYLIFSISGFLNRSKIYNSVADVIDFLNAEINLEPFKAYEPTVLFSTQGIFMPKALKLFSKLQMKIGNNWHC